MAIVLSTFGGDVVVFDALVLFLVPFDAVPFEEEVEGTTIWLQIPRAGMIFSAYCGASAAV